MATINVNTYNGLVSAIASATWGDIIACDPTVIYEGNAITLPFKSSRPNNSTFIRITTQTASGSLPASGTRTSPSFAALLPKFRTTQASNFSTIPTFQTADGAVGWQLDNIELRQSFEGGGTLLQIGDSNATLKSQLPSYIVADRVYVNCTTVASWGQHRGIEAHGNNVTVKGCYEAGVGSASTGSDSASIWTHLGDTVTVTNCYLQAGTYGFFTGGAEVKVKQVGTVLASPAPTTTTMRVQVTGGATDLPSTGAAGSWLAVSTQAGLMRRHARVSSWTLVSGTTDTYDVVLMTPIEEVPDTGTGSDVRYGFHCGNLTFTYNYVTRPVAQRDTPIIATPGGVTAAATTGGSLTAGTYNVRVTARGRNNATTINGTASAPSTLTVAASGAISVSWSAVTEATDYVVHVQHPDGTWKFKTVSTGTSTTYSTDGTAESSVPSGAVWRVKNLFEIKQCHTAALVRGNIFENSWPGVDNGQAVWIKTVNQANSSNTASRSPFNSTENVVLEYNIVRGVAGFLNLSGREFTTTNTGQFDRPTLLNGLTVRHNLVYDSGGVWNQSKSVALFNLANGGRNVVIDHNTMIHKAGTTTTDGKEFMTLSSNAGREAYLYGFVYTNNLNWFNRYGVKGSNSVDSSVGINAIAAHSANSYTFDHNGIGDITTSGYTTSVFPAAGISSTIAWPTASAFQALFTNYAGNNFTLAVGSAAIGVGTSGSNLGADMSTLATETANTTTGTAPATSPTITTSTPLSAGQVGAAYSVTLAGQDGTTPYTWSITSGAASLTGLGLALSSGGVISGTPTSAGNASFTVQLADSAAHTTTKAFTLTVAAAPATLLVTPGALTVGQVGIAYFADLQASGGAEPYSWSILSGTLPAGLTLDQVTGNITGTPTAPDSQQITFGVTDALARTAQATLILTVTSAVYTFSIGEVRQAAAIWRLPSFNNERASDKLPPYADVQTFIQEELLFKAFEKVVDEYNTSELAKHNAAFRAATLAARQKSKADVGVDD